MSVFERLNTHIGFLDGRAAYAYTFNKTALRGLLEAAVEHIQELEAEVDAKNRAIDSPKERSRCGLMV